MILVDKQIKNRKSEIFTEGYDDKNVQPISYDINVEDIICENENKSTYDLRHGEAIIVRCKEHIQVPNDLAIKVENKNSLIRAGITVTAPVYNPGHSTPIYIRVDNISGKTFTIKKGLNIAQLVFERLDDIPEITYNKKMNASFNDEDVYRGLGKYSYDMIEETERVKEELRKKEVSIYANILTLMGIFVAVLSIIIVNFQSITKYSNCIWQLVVVNCSLAIAIMVLLIGVKIIIRSSKKEK